MAEVNLDKTIPTSRPSSPLPIRSVSHLRRNWRQTRKLINVVHLNEYKEKRRSCCSIEIKSLTLKCYGKNSLL